MNPETRSPRPGRTEATQFNNRHDSRSPSGATGQDLLVTCTRSDLTALIADGVANALAELDLEGQGPPALKTKAELARELRCSIPQIDRLRRQGMPWLSIGDAVRFELAAVIEWLRGSQ